MGSRDRSDLVGKAETAKACNGDVAPRDPANRIEAFIADAKALAPGVGGTRGRLVFALDATMSRQPTWDLACGLQAEMFGTAAAMAGWTCSSCISAASRNAAPRASWPTRGHLPR